MKQKEKDAVAKLVRHMQELQRQISEPSRDEATDEEVLKLFEMLWEWTPTPRYDLPSKHDIENLVGLMRGCHPRHYCYIRSGDVARIIREQQSPASSACRTGRMLSVRLCKGADKMTDKELYDKGKWNYRETELVSLLWEMHING